jgi:trehalose 6-phosphate synthase
MDGWRNALGESGIVLASYRGPSLEDGRPAAGGLASALGDVVRSVPTTWVAAGDASPGRSPGGAFVRPVPLTPSERHLFYGGFANRFYWLMAHGIAHRYPPGQVRRWYEEGYVPANERFARAVDSALDDQAHGALSPVWIHDYHLFLVPELVRRRRPEARIGFFLHVPWPNLTAWQDVPEAPVAELAQGMLGADLVGLQTVRDAQRLLATIEEYLPQAEVCWAKIERRDRGDGPVAVGTVRVGGRTVDVRALPISVDPDAVRRRATSPRALRWRRQLAAAPPTRTVVRVDRLDPAKNIVRGFEAFERLLERRADLRGRLRFLAFLVPTRESVPEYRDYRRQVLDTARRVNARFGGEEPPIALFLQNNVEAALAGLSVADAVVINSLADGMNLVAKELVFAGDAAPALVLSRTAGVAEAYRDDALLVDPEDVEATSQALAFALDMAPAERRARLASMRAKVESWTLADWLGAQLGLLARSEPLPLALFDLAAATPQPVV